jgi:hypothetical protein
MDRAAWEVFTTTLNRTVKLLPYPYRYSFYQDGGRKMCEARHNIDSNGSKHQMWAEANRRYEGWLAADLVLQALQDLKVAEAVPTFLRLSFGLNASTESPTRRDQLARWLADGLRRRRVPVESRRVELLRVLGRYADDRDLPELLGAIKRAVRPPS